MNVYQTGYIVRKVWLVLLNILCLQSFPWQTPPKDSQLLAVHLLAVSLCTLFAIRSCHCAVWPYTNAEQILCLTINVVAIFEQSDTQERHLWWVLFRHKKFGGGKRTRYIRSSFYISSIWMKKNICKNETNLQLIRKWKDSSCLSTYKWKPKWMNLAVCCIWFRGMVLTGLFI